MPDDAAPPDTPGRLAAARRTFVANLGRRLDALDAALRQLKAERDSTSARNNLLRRVHALVAAARVLGFSAMAEALARAEHVLIAGAEHRPPIPEQLEELSRVLGSLPALVSAEDGAPSAPPERGVWPLSVVALCPVPVAEALRSADVERSVEVEHVETAARAHEVVRIVGPDVVVIDGDLRGSLDVIEAMLADPMVLPVPIVVLSGFDTPAAGARFVRLGAARVLPKPVAADTLRAAVVELARAALGAPPPNEPIGTLTIEALADRIASELRRGLVDAVQPQSRITAIPLDDGTDVLAAVWASVARIRELVTLHSAGEVRFTAEGPEGAIPFAPWTVVDRRAGERGTKSARSSEDVAIAGRRIVVADDDPAVVWFLSGQFRAAGAEVLEAHDGQTALDMAFQLWPDVVVSDVLMPELDGFSLCRDLKRDVAIRDVPVILLSWKEDLLQRVRELGADADGYLRKEANGSTIVQRVREVLRPRARVEQRMAAGGEVRGRLDGLTPRLVLQLACAAGADVRVSVRDAAYLYEVHVRQGRPIAATRTAPDGSYDSGLAALGPLLGASAGRFVVTPDGSRCRQEFHGTLEEVLTEPIQSARAAQLALSSDTLGRVCKIEFDEPALASYLASTPDPARSALRRLIDGDSPRELLLLGDISARLLEVVLSDVARHGSVRRVEDIQGRDLLPDAAEQLQRRLEAVRGRQRPSVRTARSSQPVISTKQGVSSELPLRSIEAMREAKSPSAETPVLFSFQLSPMPPPLAAPPEATEEPDSGGWQIAEPVVRSPDWPLNPNITPGVPGAARERSGFAVESGTWPGVGEPNALAVDAPDEPAPELATAVLGGLEEPPAAPAAVAPSTPEPIAIRAIVRPKPSSTPPAAADPEPEPEPEDEPEPPATEALATPEDEPDDVSPAIERGDGYRSFRIDELVSTVRDERDAAAAEADAHSEPPEVDAETPRPTTGAPVAHAREGRLMNAVRLGLTMLGAGIVSFLLVRLVVPRESDAPEAAQAAPTEAAAPAAVKPKPAPIVIPVEDLPLPEGIPLSAGKALLEVSTGGRQFIYVDGEFVGRGPVRQVPVEPGTHEIRTKEGDQERTDSVSTKAGRRTRVGISRAWQK